MRVEVHELHAHLLKGALGEQVALDAVEGLVRILECLLDEGELFPLVLVQPRLDGVGLLESLEAEDEDLGVVLVAARGEGHVEEAPRLQPMHQQRMHRHRLLRLDVRPLAQVAGLPLLLLLEEEASEAANVLLAHGLVDSCPALDALAREVRAPASTTPP